MNPSIGFVIRFTERWPCYCYDGLGHRVKTINADGSTQVSLYTQGGQLLFTNKVGGSNAGKTSYIYLDRHQIAEVNW